MKSSTLISASFALALAACATQEPPKPAPAPEPRAAPAPAPKPAPIQEVKPVPKPEPKKPAVVNLGSTELFEFNKAALTDEAKRKLDAEVVAKLKDFGQIRYINVNGHADRLGRNAGVNSWNQIHPSQGCGLEQLAPTGGAGLLYCFATN
jgi:outer membrane protein OmpA-like peptidoglycan-associated protein